jgi:predicted nucleic acid-binding Zn ribbon protein
MGEGRGGRDGAAGSGGRDRGRGGDRGMGRVDEVLGGLLRNLGIHEEVARQGVLERWAEVVGEQIAAVTRARSVSRGTLFVDVRSSAWITELNLMRHELMTRLNAGAGDGRVERIVFTQAEDAGRDFRRDRDEEASGSGGASGGGPERGREGDAAPG